MTIEVPLSKKSKELLKALKAARTKCYRLHDQRNKLEEKLMQAMGNAAKADADYRISLSQDEDAFAKRKQGKPS